LYYLGHYWFGLGWSWAESGQYFLGFGETKVEPSRFDFFTCSCLSVFVASLKNTSAVWKQRVRSWKHTCKYSFLDVRHAHRRSKQVRSVWLRYIYRRQ